MPAAALIKLFDDQYIFAVNKPAGLHSVELETGGGESVAKTLLELSPELSQVAERPGDAGLINRLDQMTSGVLIGAKNREMWLALRELLEGGGIAKNYLALLDGRLGAGQTRVTGWIGSRYRRSKKVTVYADEPRSGVRALEASTVFKMISYLADINATMAHVSAPTARRHQIRAHASSIGHPLTGDGLYGSGQKLSLALLKLGYEGKCPEFFLHAHKAAFAHPISGQKLLIEAPPPDWSALLLTGAGQKPDSADGG